MTSMRFSKSGRKHVLVYCTSLSSLLDSGFARFQRSRKKEHYYRDCNKMLEQICRQVIQRGDCQILSNVSLFVVH